MRQLRLMIGLKSACFEPTLGPCASCARDFSRALSKYRYLLRILIGPSRSLLLLSRRLGGVITLISDSHLKTAELTKQFTEFLVPTFVRSPLNFSSPFAERTRSVNLNTHLVLVEKTINVGHYVEFQRPPADQDTFSR